MNDSLTIISPFMKIESENRNRWNEINFGQSGVKLASMEFEPASFSVYTHCTTTIYQTKSALGVLRGGMPCLNRFIRMINIEELLS